MKHVLRWDPVEVTDELIPVTYNVEYAWHNDAHQLCVNITETQCDFTDKILTFFRGTLKVQAQLGERRSKWTETGVFQASWNTTIGPVKSLILVPHSGQLDVDFSPPFSPIPNTWTMKYRLIYWKENSKEEKEVNLGIKTIYRLNNLEPWTKYCVRVTSCTHYIQGQTSDPVCETTTNTEFTTWQLIMIVVFSFVGFALFVFGVYLVHKKGCVLLKHFLYPPFVMPSHMQEYLQNPPQHAYVENCEFHYNEEQFDDISLVGSACLQDGRETCTEVIQHCAEKT
ncbi:interleukin-10 receptor subunit beta-like isoform X2 [Mixophyes fleayi]